MARYPPLHIILLCVEAYACLQEYSCTERDLLDQGELGKGAFGAVRLMRHKALNLELAVKVCLCLPCSRALM